MCGITGIFDLQGGRAIDRELLERMNEVQHHRGPDETGVHVEPGVGLAHKRLSIIDLSSGQQPLANEDGSVIVVYNGEIYNFQELAEELKAAGHIFRTHCDTEVIVHAWEQWGEASVNRFRGMFAFAVWDRNRKTLFLARDRLGIKPLFYAFLPDGQLIFGSELKALMAHPGLSRELNHQAVEDYFAYGYIPEPKTIYAAAAKLSPGHTLTVKQGERGAEQRQYWDVPFAAFDGGSEGDVQRELVERLKEAVSVRLISEVPLGAFLSGGVDSSAVVALMAELSRDPVHTCSIAFRNPRFDESSEAEKVARLLHTDHYVETVDTDDFDLVDRLSSLYDEPYADSSAIPTYRVCELARKRVTVALSGDGGDENFAGYRRYKWHMNEQWVRNLIPQGIRSALFGTAGRLYPKLDWAPRVFRAKSTLEGIGRDEVNAYFHTVSILGDRFRKDLFSPDFQRQLGGYTASDVLYGHAAKAPTNDPLSLVQYLDMKTYLVGDILTKVDRASMAHSLEVRVPFLDHPFVEWVSSLPAGLKLKGQETKYVLKKSLESRLPNDILYRSKMGFGVPLADWFRGPLKQRIRDAMLGGTLADTGHFNQKYLKHLVDQHQASLKDYSSPLWTLLMYEAFLRRTQ